jgi:DnaJ-class molecular chaperone
VCLHSNVWLLRIRLPCLIRRVSKFNPISSAYDVLSDAVKRKEYDLLLEHGHFKYDPRVYAEIMNEKNQAWGRRAGFSFGRRSVSAQQIVCGSSSSSDWNRCSRARLL